MATAIDRPQRFPWTDIAGLATAFVVCFGISALGAVGTQKGLTPWYASLNKPAWNPPNWVFAPVWTLLFAMMAVSVWLVWRQRRRLDSDTVVPLLLFGSQLLLNAAWSWLFFAWKLPGLAFVEILVLWVFILATIIAFWKRSNPAALLLVPYLLWVTYASTLNGAITLLN